MQKLLSKTLEKFHRTKLLNVIKNDTTEGIIATLLTIAIVYFLCKYGK